MHESFYLIGSPVWYRWKCLRFPDKKAPLEIPDESDESDNENPQMNNRNEEEDNYIKKIARNLWNVKRPDWTAVSAVFEVLEK